MATKRGFGDEFYLLAIVSVVAVVGIIVLAELPSASFVGLAASGKFTCVESDSNDQYVSEELWIARSGNPTWPVPDVCTQNRKKVSSSGQLTQFRCNPEKPSVNRFWDIFSEPPMVLDEVINCDCTNGACAEPQPTCIDVDGDGYYSTSSDAACPGVRDCNDIDNEVNPGLQEICGDGKDNDCSGTVDDGCEIPPPPSCKGDVAALHLDSQTNDQTPDSSDNAHAGVVSGATTIPNGKFGGAFSFDGADDKIDLLGSFDFSGQSFSVSTWLKPDTLTGEQTFFSIHSQSSQRKSIHLRMFNNGKIRFGYYDLSGNKEDDLDTNSVVLQQGVWQHVVVTYNAQTDTSTIYVNKNNEASGSQGPFEGTNPKVGIGYWATGSGTQYFDGSIDEVHIFDHALSASEIDGLYTGEDCDVVIPNCVDNDGDGYGVGPGCSGPQDCNDNDDEVNPGLSEVCGDGKDNDCSGTVDDGCGSSCGNRMCEEGENYRNCQLDCIDPVVEARYNNFLQQFDEEFEKQKSQFRQMALNSEFDSRNLYSLQKHMEALLNVYEATGDQKYFDEALNYSLIAMSTARDYTQADHDSGVISGNWQYYLPQNYKDWPNNPNNGAPNELDDYQIGSVMARIAWMITVYPALEDQYSQEAHDIADFVETHIVEKWLIARNKWNNWINTARNYEYWNDKGTHNALIAYYLYQMGRTEVIHNGQTYDDYALSLVNEFKERTSIDLDGAMLWDLYDNPDCDYPNCEQSQGHKGWELWYEYPAPDVWHRNREAYWMIYAAENSFTYGSQNILVFGDEEIQHLAKTFKTKIWNGISTWDDSDIRNPDKNMWFSSYIDGSREIYQGTSYGWSGQVVEGFCLLGVADRETQELCEDLLDFLNEYGYNVNMMWQRNAIVQSGNEWGKFWLLGNMVYNLKFKSW